MGDYQKGRGKSASGGIQNFLKFKSWWQPIRSSSLLIHHFDRTRSFLLVGHSYLVRYNKFYTMYDISKENAEAKKEIEIRGRYLMMAYDRFTILSEQVLIELRAYYRLYRPTEYLFNGQTVILYPPGHTTAGVAKTASIL